MKYDEKNKNNLNIQVNISIILKFGKMLILVGAILNYIQIVTGYCIEFQKINFSVTVQQKYNTFDFYELKNKLYQCNY